MLQLSLYGQLVGVMTGEPIALRGMVVFSAKIFPVGWNSMIVGASGAKFTSIGGAVCHTTESLTRYTSTPGATLF